MRNEVTNSFAFPAVRHPIWRGYSYLTYIHMEMVEPPISSKLTAASVLRTAMSYLGQQDHSLQAPCCYSLSGGCRD